MKQPNEIPAAPIVAPLLVSWFEQHARDLPWRRGVGAYGVWLSEVILQQTRVAQGLAYFQRFMEVFPTVEALARATEDEVLHLWQGLGYYSRARHLHKAAQQIVSQYQGVLPHNYTDLRSLPGVGEYTAGAILAFAYHLPYPAVDGNVLRVVSRLCASTLPIDSPEGKRFCKTYVERLLQTGASPSDLGQGLIELGALVCTPKAPHCDSCPLQRYCKIADTPQAEELPYKGSTPKVRIRKFHYFWLHSSRGELLVYRRNKGDIWQGLYDLPLWEEGVQENPPLPLLSLLPNAEGAWRKQCCYTTVRKLTHQQLQIAIYPLPPYDGEAPEGYLWLSPTELKEKAMPTYLIEFLQKQGKR